MELLCMGSTGWNAFMHLQRWWSNNTTWIFVFQSRIHHTSQYFKAIVTHLAGEKPETSRIYDLSALTVSPDGVYCVAAVSEIIYIWKISLGVMLAMLSRHYQTVSSLSFTDDGSHFISAGQDGMMLVWKLSSILTATGYSNQETIPLYSFSDHTLSITDIFIGKCVP